jgi:UDP-2,4-diacetamido-2,4,6-trideoxy-beta-L-altropyranose hydrolase
MNRPLAVLRADASASIGTGHVVRSTVLGQALAAAGWSVVLVAREIPDALATAAEAASLTVHRLPGGVAAADEPAAIARAVAPAAALVVGDSYELDAAWYEAMARALPGARLAAIDDLADRPLPVDLLLNQNLGVSADAYEDLLPPSAVRLLGPTYALVRREFAARRAGAERRDGTIRRVLVFLSGADPADVTRTACLGLADLDLAVDVVVGAAYPHLDRLQSLVGRQPAFRLHRNTAAMADLMAAADLAIGAPSSASWERCTLGLPAVVVVLADNQVAVGRHLDEAGAVINLGWYNDLEAADIARAVTLLRGDPVRVAGMASAAMTITDGRGADRVATAVSNLWRARSEDA